MRVIIAGGGVGGLTLALMLHQRGIEAVVLEASADVRPLGVGINALPHAIRELACLGLLPDLDAAGVRTRRLTYATHLGQEIWSEPRGLHAGHEHPQFSIHRGHLQTLLWRAVGQRLGPAALRTDARVTAVAPMGAGVAVCLASADGRTDRVTGDALVGADGIHSALRAILFPDDPGIRWNGIQMWRGAVDWPVRGGGDEMIVAGDAVAKLVLYPIGPGSDPGRRLTNWVIYARVGDPATPPPTRESWSQPAAAAEFAPLTARFRLPDVDIAALVGATGQIFRYPMCDRDPLPHWTRGSVTLLGDAAHPMYPVGSNGASQAILDARCLSDLLAARPVEDALHAYDDARRPVTADLVRSNRIGGPERVIDLVAHRAPDGFERLSDVASHEELAGIVKGYAGLAGFAVPAREKTSA